MGPYAWEWARPVKRVRSSATPPPVNLQSLPLEEEEHHPEKKTRGYVLNHLPVWKDLFLLHDELKHLPRSLDVFRKVEGNPALSLQLPKPGVTAGRVLEHAAQVFTKLHDRNHPMTFKFGITMDAAVRWQYYDKCSKDRFDYMVIIYGASNPHGPAFLEAALIDRFQSFPVALCFSLHATS